MVCIWGWWFTLGRHRGALRSAVWLSCICESGRHERAFPPALRSVPLRAAELCGAGTAGQGCQEPHRGFRWHQRETGFSKGVLWMGTATARGAAAGIIGTGLGQGWDRDRAPGAVMSQYSRGLHGTVPFGTSLPAGLGAV